MLCLSARVGEKVVVFLNGKTVEVTILETRGRQVRLGFVADPAVKVMRQSVLDRANKETDRAERFKAIDEAVEGDGERRGQD